MISEISGQMVGLKGLREYNEAGSHELTDYLVIQQDLQDAQRALEFMRSEFEKPDENQDNFTLRMYWTAAIVKFFRCFEKGKAKKQTVDTRIFADASDKAPRAYQYMKTLRDKALVHDYAPYIQCRVGAVPYPDLSIFAVGELMVTVEADDAHVGILGMLTEIALEHVKGEIETLKGEIFKSIDRLGGIDWVLDQPEALLEIPGTDAITENRKDWTSRAASKSRKRN